MSIGLDGEQGILDEKGKKIGYTLIPNFLALHPDTTYQVYREFIPRRRLVELTIFYREPGKGKFRVDAEMDEDTISGIQDEDLGPQHVRIVQWGDATKVVP